MPRSASPTSESAPPASPDIAVEVVRTCTHARMHAASCDACTQVPAALKPSRNCANQICWRCAGFCRYTAGLPASHTQHSTRNAQRTQPNLEGHRRSLPRRCRKLACRRVGAALTAGGNGRRVTNRSSRLIIVVYSPSAAPARSCSSGTQRSQRPVLGAGFAMRVPRGTGAMGDSSRSPHRCSASKVAPT